MFMLPVLSNNGVYHAYFVISKRDNPERETMGIAIWGQKTIGNILIWHGPFLMFLRQSPVFTQIWELGKANYFYFLFQVS